jgi:hypothetical protein
MRKEVPQDHWVMLHLSFSVVGGGHGVVEAKVPEPNFITQGVSLHRDVVYLISSSRLMPMTFHLPSCSDFGRKEKSWRNKVRMASDWLSRQERSTEVHVEGWPLNKEFGACAVVLLLPKRDAIKTRRGPLGHRDSYIWYALSIFEATASQRGKGSGMDRNIHEALASCVCGEG